MAKGNVDEKTKKGILGLVNLFFKKNEKTNKFEIRGGKKNLANNLIKGINRRTREKESEYSVGELKNFIKEEKLTPKEAFNVVTNNPTTKKEQQAHAKYTKEVAGKKLVDIYGEAKKGNIKKIYKEAKQIQDPTSTKTEEQQEANKKAIEQIQNAPNYQVYASKRAKNASSQESPIDYVRGEIRALSDAGAKRILKYFDDQKAEALKTKKSTKRLKQIQSNIDTLKKELKDPNLYKKEIKAQKPMTEKNKKNLKFLYNLQSRQNPELKKNYPTFNSYLKQYEPKAKAGGKKTAKAAKAIRDVGKITNQAGQELKIAPENISQAQTVAEIERRKQLFNTLYPGVQDIVENIGDAYQQGAPPVERFGTPSSNELLNAYDDLVNVVRPERTQAQRGMAAFAPYAAKTGGTLGTTLGSLIGGPGFGSALGGGIGSALGLALKDRLEKGGQPDPELASIGKLISGTPTGYFKSGKPGLAGLISGEDTRSTLRTLGGLRRRPGPIGKIGDIRRSVGSGVKSFGNWLSEPGRAQQIRSGIEGAQALYGLTGELGINSLVGSGLSRLGRALGILSPDAGNLQSGGTGQDIARLALPSALDFAVPELQRQASQFYRRPVSAQRVTRGLDQQLLGAIGSQMAGQNIRSSQLQGQKEALMARKDASRVDKEMQQVLNMIKAQQQNQAFTRNVRRQNFNAREMFERAKINARRNKLAKMELLSGQPIVNPLPLERAQTPAGIPEALNFIANETQKATGPFVQSRLSDIFKRPVKLKPKPVVK